VEERLQPYGWLGWGFAGLGRVRSQPSTVGATSDTQVSARHRLIAPDTLNKAQVRPPLSPSGAGLLVIEPTPLTTLRLCQAPPVRQRRAQV
jgi:hypothetical protein